MWGYPHAWSVDARKETNHDDICVSPSQRRGDPARRRLATWAVHEAPTSCCLRWQVGKLEFMYTLRGIDDAELHQRLARAVPWLLALVKGMEAEAVPPAPVPWDPDVLPARSTPSPTAPAVPEDWCPHHQVTMEQRRNAQGWYSHRLDDGTYCKGK